MFTPDTENHEGMGVPETDEDQLPCPECGCEERNDRTGLLTCECLAPALVTSLDQQPVSSWVDSWERGLDPWHADAFLADFKTVGTVGPRAEGWYALDYWGNVVGWVPDGSPITDIQSSVLVVVE